MREREERTDAVAPTSYIMMYVDKEHCTVEKRDSIFFYARSTPTAVIYRIRS